MSNRKNGPQDLRHWTSAQLRPLQLELMRLRQEVHAMQCILDGLVAMHPHPQELLRVWRQMHARLIDPLGQAGAVSPHPPMAGWRDVMRRYIDILELGLRMQERPPPP